MKAVILVNRHGGSAGDGAHDRVAAALVAAGISGEVELVAGAALASRAAQAVADGARLVIAAGGDGTLSSVAGALVGTDATLGILPLGTLNHLARDLGIGFKLDQAAAVIAAGNRQRIDVAECNGRIFVNNSAIGLYPLMVADREGQQRLGRSKRAAMFVAGLRTLALYHHHRLTLTVNDGETRTIDTPLLFVGNNDYRLDLRGPGRRATIRDGRLSVIVMRRMGRAGFFAAMIRALFGRSRPGDMIHLDDVQRLRVASRRTRLTVSGDGETREVSPPLDYRIRPGALAVMVPPDPAPASSTANKRRPRR